MLSTRNGRYGSAYLNRAIVAYIGLGALAADEALYAADRYLYPNPPVPPRHR